MSITVTRTSTSQFRVLIPLSGTRYVEYRMKVNAPYATWGLQGVYGRDLTLPNDDIQMSDGAPPPDTSVSEYALGICVSGAPRATFDYVGMAHGRETLTSLSLTLDGSSVLGWTTGQTATGTTFVVSQAMNLLLPKNADGSTNGVTVCGSGTCAHTFTAATQLSCAHAHTLNAGYDGLAWFAAAWPVNVTNFNRIQIGALPVFTLLHDGALSLVNSVGVEAATFSAWDSSAHPYLATQTITGAGPDLVAGWTYAATERGWFEDGSDYGKWRVQSIGSADIARRTGPFTVSSLWTAAVTLNDSIVFDDSVFGAEPFMQDIAADMTASDAPVTVATTTDALVTS